MGWNNGNVYNVLEVTDKVYDLAYELKNCVRGAYTGCETYEDLQEYIRRLARELEEAADMMELTDDVCDVCDECDDYDDYGHLMLMKINN